MLRALVLALLVANLCFWAWTQGWLDGVVGLRASGDREPERLGRQVRPESVRILPPAAAASAASTADGAALVACLESGPFASAAAASAAEAALRGALPALPRERWAAVKTDLPGTWIVYMGKYDSPDLLARKEDELKRRKVEYTALQGNPALEPGLLLGRFDERGAADKALAQLVRQGVRSAHVVETAASASAHTLRITRADPPLAAQLTALTGDALGRGFTPCADGVGTR